MKTIEMAKDKAFNLFLDDIYTDAENSANTDAAAGTDAEKLTDAPAEISCVPNTDAPAEISCVPNTDAAGNYVAIWEYGVPDALLARREYKTAKGAVNFVLTAVYTGVGYATKNCPVKGASIETGNGKKLARVYVEDSGKIEVETFTDDIQREIENWHWENRKITKRYYAKIAAEISYVPNTDAGNDNTGAEKINLAVAENTDAENVTFNLATDAENDNTSAEKITDDTFDVETVLSISAATITDAIYVSIDATALDTYIAIFKQGDMFMKKGMALKMIALALIDYFNLYTDKGYNNVYAFAEGELKLAKQTARRYLQTATQFYDIQKIATDVQLKELLDENGNFKKNPKFAALSIFADSKGNDFTPAALQAITAISVDDIKSLLTSGELTYDMTVPEIRNAVSKYRKSAKKAARAAKLDNTDAAAENDNLTIDVENDNTAGVQAEKIATDAGTGTDALKKALALIAKLQAENDELKAENDELHRMIDSISQGYENRIEELNGTIDTVTAEYEDKLDVVTAENALLREQIYSVDKYATDAFTENPATDAENYNLANTDAAIWDIVEVGNINPQMQALYEKMKLTKTAGTDAAANTDAPHYSPALATYVFVDDTDDTDAI